MGKLHRLGYATGHGHDFVPQLGRVSSSVINRRLSSSTSRMRRPRTAHRSWRRAGRDAGQRRQLDRCRTSRNGTQMSHRTPRSSNTRSKVPAKSPSMQRSIRRLPNPRRVGAFTIGPLCSRHCKASRLGVSPSTTSQETVSEPPGVERAPYLVAFVANSFKVSVNSGRCAHRHRPKVPAAAPAVQQVR